MGDVDPRDRLRDEIATVTWQQLRPHAAADRLFLVGTELALLDAAIAVAQDDTDAVGQWIETQQLCRPTQEEMKSWERDGAGFRFVIVSPFVLAELLSVREAGDPYVPTG